MTTTLIVLLSLFCGLPILLALILTFIVIKWGVKTLWKIVTWPFRAIAGLFHKNSDSPAPVAAPTAPVQDDRARNGAVTQSQNVTVNSGAGGTAIAIVALVVVVAIIAICAFLLFGRTPAAVSPCNNCGSVAPTAQATAVVVVPTAQPVANDCPHGQFIGASPELTVSFMPGTWYHVNMSVKGNEAGIENNVLFNPKTPFTMVFDGNVYSYASLPAADCQLFVETRGDTWHKVDQLPDSLVEYAFPVGENGSAGNEIIFSVTKDDGTVVFSATKVETGVIIQGEDVSGTCVAGAWCGLSWYVPSGPETVTLFHAVTDVTISGFNGTLSQWDHEPTAEEIGNKPASTVQEAKASGITFQGDLQ